MKTSSIDGAILEILDRTTDHLKAHEIYRQLKPRFPSVNPSSVYRSVERLARTGKISVSDMGTGALVYQKLGMQIHHHLVCQRCNNIQTIDHAVVSPFFEQIQAEFKFEVLTNHLVLFGICQQCKEGGSLNQSAE